MSLEEIEKKVTRVSVMPLEEIEGGMVSAIDIKTSAGAIIIPAYCEIEERHIGILQEAGITKLEIIRPKKVKPRPPASYVPWPAPVKAKDPVYARVLIVDDSSIMRRTLKMILEKMEIDVVGEANDGSEAIKLAEELKPSLITMDIKMPGMDGIEAVKKLKSILPKTKIIMVSMDGKENKVIECIKNGASDFIQKPFHRTRVEKAVLKALEAG